MGPHTIIYFIINPYNSYYVLYIFYMLNDEYVIIYIQHVSENVIKWMHENVMNEMSRYVRNLKC